ncbi:hypothetical protein FHS85_005129 [Rhodoligotrophos appendicifer]|uniref:hypothetical protein n=1 Tax=Rhodoligotrophos appendicifer TaxID=987056 RepID=UPI00117C0C9C|nr:hypothetical protein [Rhodoligotrophos appendicifer]
MAGNVISLGGAIVPEEAQANATLVEELERLLEAAKAGEIIGMAGSYVHKGRAASYSYAGNVGGFAIIGGLECAKEHLVRLALL